MTSIPLLGFAASEPLVYDARIVTRGEFVATALTLAAQIPETRYAINLCDNRYRFMLGFAAACIRHQTNLLPANQASGALQALAAAYPEHHVLDDTTVARMLVHANRPAATTGTPTIDSEHIAAVCFTSGSTGVPQAHANTWGTLAASAHRSAAGIFVTPGLNLVATVPPQHMFGLETSILQPLFNRCAVHASRPFFPADIVATLATLARPRALITTPAHLRACLAAAQPMPELEFVLSATAPLSVELASQAEVQWRTRLLEIYGSTETGAIATRRTTEGATWSTLPGGSVLHSADGARYRPDGASSDVVLHDALTRLDATHFQLAGRSQDLIKVAGKRASLAELNTRLLAIAGVQDGIVFQPLEDGRVAALAVAPTISPRDILSALSANVDEVFLPRPLRMVAALPRDALGKLSRARLLAALEQGDG